jgi:AcrR family transcriptional regulator
MSARRARGDRSRAQILGHSVLIASTAGLEGLSIGRVAAEAGVGKGNIQVLFGDKEALQLATLEAAVERFNTAVVFPALRKKTPLEKLLALVKGWFSFVEKRTLPGGCFMHAVSSEYRLRSGRVRDRINEHRAAIRDRLREVISEAKAAGELREDMDAEQLIFDLIASEAAANVASLMGDDREFKRARSTSLARIRSGMTLSKSKRSRPSRGRIRQLSAS